MEVVFKIYKMNYIAYLATAELPPLNRARRPMALSPTLDKDLCMVHWDGLELPYCGCVYEKFWNGLALIRNIIQNYHFRPS